MVIGMLLASLRIAAGKTQANVASELGVALLTVNRHERGKTPLNGLQRRGYANYYGVRVEDIEQPAEVSQ